MGVSFCQSSLRSPSFWLSVWSRTRHPGRTSLAIELGAKSIQVFWTLPSFCGIVVLDRWKFPVIYRKLSPPSPEYHTLGTAADGPDGANPPVGREAGKSGPRNHRGRGRTGGSIRGHRFSGSEWSPRRFTADAVRGTE